ncbi:MAG: SAM-dependent methyltransferase [Snowella sp.]|jgi:predicted O-methyltransferase YrrM|nr:MAG: SAM-dependent methyltransferase [Snowella sp.]
MSKQTTGLAETLADYIQSISLREPDILKQLREETVKLSMARMQISPEQGQLMALLVQLMGAKKTLEIGVFTGYSALAVALALPVDGKMIACEISEEYTAIAKDFWGRAGVSEKIDLRIAPALETLEKLIAEGKAGSFDLAFIDADKRNYENYYERVLTLLRPGGLILIDNVLWSGKVVDPTITDKQTQAIREFNQKLHQDSRISLSVVAIADGLTLALKR